MRRMLKEGKGQVLVISLVAFLALFFVIVLIIETGNVLYQKTHMQNIADSAAMEGGLWYARCLNIASISNKVLVCSGLVGVIGELFGIKGAFKLPGYVAKIQNIFTTVAPFAVELAIIRNCKKNDTFGAGIFNVEDFSDCGIVPSFQLKRLQLTDMFTKKITYCYHSSDTGEKVCCDESEVDWNEKARRWQRKNDPRYFVSRRVEQTGTKEKNDEKPCMSIDLSKLKKKAPKEALDTAKESVAKEKAEMPLVLEETGGHTVLVMCGRNKFNLISGERFFKNSKGKIIKPSMMFASSMIRVSGGSMEIFKINGASYEASFEHIILPEIKDFEMFKSIQGITKYFDKFTQGITDNVILH